MKWEDLLQRAYPEGRRNGVFYRRNEVADPRLGELIRTWDRSHEIQELLDSSPAVFILGIPDDRGVRAAQGRPGARLGPEAIRKAFYRLTPGFIGGWTDRVVDLGNLAIPEGASMEERLEKTQLLAEELTYYVSLSGSRLVILGGGQDLTYGTVSGFARARRNLSTQRRAREGSGSEAVDWFGLINVDKFLDVRDPALTGRTSGTAFYRILEEEDGPVDPSNFVAFAIQEQHCSAAHRSYLKSKGSTLISLEQFWLGRENILNSFSQALDIAGRETCETLLSFDLNATVMPGVSAPSPLGLQPGSCCALASMAGERGVSLFELMETSPPHDTGTETSTLAATMLFYYLRGLAAGEHL